MTCREKLRLEHPDCVNDIWAGGAKGCPANYGYLPQLFPDCEYEPAAEVCTKCWNREIPDNENWVEVHVTNPEKPIIKDSGNRRQFDTGAVRDMQEGKGRCDLMPLGVVAFLISGRSIETEETKGIVLHNIRAFLEKNDTYYLYLALEHFCNRCYERSIPTMFLEAAKHFEEGAKKYGENNWQKGIPVNCYIDSAVRHYLKWLRGDKDEPHDRAFVWNLMCCIWEVDYREKKDEVSNS